MNSPLIAPYVPERMAGLLLFMWLCGVFVWGVGKIGEMKR